MAIMYHVLMYYTCAWYCSDVARILMMLGHRKGTGCGMGVAKWLQN